MAESIYLIYKHTSPSGKSYIGQTKDYGLRSWQHMRLSSGCKAFSAAIKKYGWDNFTHEFLAEHIATEDEANTLEEYYIKEYQTLSPNGYNLTTGGGSCRVSDETKSKMSDAAFCLPTLKRISNNAVFNADTRSRLLVSVDFVAAITSEKF